MSSRVLVTGSSGFVGTRLCAHLESRGFEVYGCDALASPGEKNRSVCDIADPTSIKEALSWASPLDYVIHLAGWAGRREVILVRSVPREVTLVPERPNPAGAGQLPAVTTRVVERRVERFELDAGRLVPPRVDRMR